MVMSIRNRVMWATLGVAVAGFVVTLGAQDDKVLIVADGSVEVYINRSTFDAKKGNRHKWSKKADWIQVFEERPNASGAITTEPCTSNLSPLVKFERAVLKIKDRTNNRDIEIGADNDGVIGFRTLKLEMPRQSQWQFAFRQFRRKLVNGNQEPDLKLEQVVINPGTPQTQTLPPQPSTSPAIVCVHFIDR
jgi:hypothetical protein